MRRVNRCKRLWIGAIAGWLYVAHSGSLVAELPVAPSPVAPSLVAIAQEVRGETNVSPSQSAASAPETAAAPLSPWPVSPFHPLATSDQQAAREATKAAAVRLEAFLNKGTAANAQAWKDFLLWPKLQEQLATDGPANTEALGQVAAKLLSGEVGLELPAFVGLRNAVVRQLRVAQAINDPETARRYDEQLAAIRDLIPQAVLAPAAHQADLSGRVDWLEQLHQSPELVHVIRQHFSRPNLIVSASSQTLARGFSEPIAEVTPVNEMILKTHVHGTATTHGTVTARLVPSQQHAMIDLVMQGTSASQTVGRQKPVTIFSHGVTQIFASKRLVIDPLSIRDEPAFAQCSTQSNIQSIQPDRRFGARLVERVAWKQAGQQQPLAEQISSRRAEGRIAQRFNQRVQERIADTNARLESKVRRPLQRRNIYPDHVQLSTTQDRLHVVIRQSHDGQLAAASTPPSIPAHHLLVQVHESMLANTAHTAMGGITITDERAQQLIKELTGEVPAELQLKQDEDPWSITFDLQQPVQVEFKDNQLSIAIRGRKFTRGDQAVTQTTQIGAKYAMELVGGRMRLVRQGGVEVTFPGKDGERLSLAELRNKTFFTNKFEGLFKPVIEGQGLKLAKQWQNLDRLSLQFVSTQNGWLSLGWN